MLVGQAIVDGRPTGLKERLEEKAIRERSAESETKKLTNHPEGDTEGRTMPDVTLVVRGIAETGEPEHLERALARLGFVDLVSVDPSKKFVAVSYEGGEAELERIGQAVEEAGYEYEYSPGAGEVAKD
jgi:copper chaperone CopZ